MASHGLLHIALLTRDLKKTEQFYTDVLGLKVAFRVPPNMLFLRSPGSQDLLNFVRTKKRITPNSQALQRLQDNDYRLKAFGKAAPGEPDRHRREARQARDLLQRSQRLFHRVLLRLKIRPCGVSRTAAYL